MLKSRQIWSLPQRGSTYGVQHHQTSHLGLALTEAVHHTGLASPHPPSYVQHLVTACMPATPCGRNNGVEGTPPPDWTRMAMNESETKKRTYVISVWKMCNEGGRRAWPGTTLPTLTAKARQAEKNTPAYLTVSASV